jgi:hypothetical protein
MKPSKVRQFAWPFPLPLSEAARRNTMTQTHSKSRQKAESAFTKAQSQFLARSRAVEEYDMIVQARRENTLRLKEARLAKEADDRARETAALISKRTLKD